MTGLPLDRERTQEFWRKEYSEKHALRASPMLGTTQPLVQRDTVPSLGGLKAWELQVTNGNKNASIYEAFVTCRPSLKHFPRINVSNFHTGLRG